VIERGNMTDAEYIVALEKEYIHEIRRLENEIKKRDKQVDKLEVEIECLKIVIFILKH
jgi:hypothetical protein